MENKRAKSMLRLLIIAIIIGLTSSASIAYFNSNANVEIPSLTIKYTEE